MEHGQEQRCFFPEIKHKIEQGIRKTSAVGSIALAACTLAYGANKIFFSQSGDHMQYGTCGDDERVFDNKVGAVNWNMQDEITSHKKDIKLLIKKTAADVAMFQEVSGNDARKLSKMFPGWCINFVVAERIVQEGFDGGNGDVIMSKYPVEDVKTKAIKADPWHVKAAHAAWGLIEDNAEAFQDTLDKGRPVLPDMSEATEGLQESRAIIALTIPIKSNGKETELRVITTHIAGVPRMHQMQYDKVVDFVRREIKPGRPILFCADLNRPQRSFNQTFRNLGFKAVQKAGRTSVNNNVAIDNCVYRPENSLDVAEILPEYGVQTDHYPVTSVIDTDTLLPWQIRQMALQ